jgi:hypothetical protein
MRIVEIGMTGSGTPSPATVLNAAVQRWQRQIVRLFDPYRPECHYMRGPGPKCREKRGLSGRAL